MNQWNEAKGGGNTPDGHRAAELALSTGDGYDFTLLSALDAIGIASSPTQRATQMGTLPAQALLPFRTTTGTSTLGMHPSSSTSFVEGDRAPFSRQPQDIELRRQQQLLSAILLQRQQQEQALLAAAMVSSGFASLVPSSFFTGGSQLATFENTLVARARLEQAQAHLRYQSVLESAESRSAIATSLPGEGSSLSPLAVANPVIAHQDQKLPFYCNASKIPDPSSEDEEDDEEEEELGSTSEVMGEASATVPEKFPFKLYRMLSEAEKNGDDSIVSFFPHGRAFSIHKPREFVAILMPKYFSTVRMSSFQRQLNLYGFRRISGGRDKGGYFHECFLRGRKRLCKKIHRQKTAPRTFPDTDTARASESMYEAPFAAASTSTSNHEFFALLSQRNLMQRQQLSAQLQAPSLATRLAQLPTSANLLLGTGQRFGGSLMPGLCASALPGAPAEPRRLSSEIAISEGRRSDIMRQLHQYRQVHGTKSDSDKERC